MITLRTEFSVYLFDEAGRYLRMPRNEMPRDPDEQYMQWLSNGPMDDNQWHDLVFVGLATRGDRPDRVCLQIKYVGAINGLITSPIEIEDEEAAALLCARYEEET